MWIIVGILRINGGLPGYDCHYFDYSLLPNYVSFYLQHVQLGNVMFKISTLQLCFDYTTEELAGASLPYES